MKLLGLPSVAPLLRVVCVSTFAAAVVSSSAARAQTQGPPPTLQVPGAATTAAPITPPPATTTPPTAAPPPPGVPPPAYPGVPPTPGTAAPPATAAPPTYYPPPPQGGPPPGPPGAQPPPGSAPPGYPPPPPGYAYYSAPPAYRPTVVPPVKSTAGVHLHNGFYLRLGLGVTQASGSIDTPSVARPVPGGNYREIGGRANGKISGNGAAFDFAMGGTVYRGLAVAGYASGRSLGDANVRFDTGSTSDRVFNKDFQLASVGVMGDWYIDPRKGLHVQGGVGIASVTHAVESRFDGTAVKDSTARYSGLGLHLGVGYESFVSDDWSIGGLLRIDVANNLTSDTDGNDATPRDTSINVFAPSLLFTGTYN